MNKGIMLLTFLCAVALAGTGCPDGSGEQEDAEFVNPQTLDPFQRPVATSLLGEPLYAPQPSEELVQKYEAAKETYMENPDSADALIWYGRRTAYLGEYDQAIRLYGVGIEKFPQDPRFLRHRGHRFISVRQFDDAVADLQQAADMVAGQADVVEPDGMPNDRGVPVSSLKSNIWYHLGLAHYLKGGFDKALGAWEKGAELADNPDKTVSNAHWHYMTLRRLGKSHEEAAVALADVSADMDIIENHSYWRLCRFYQGAIPEESLLEAEAGTSTSDAVLYGIANWHLYNGHTDRAEELLNDLLDKGNWASFGYIAAEADIARLFHTQEESSEAAHP